MPFQKNHKYRWQSHQDRSLDKAPICFKGWEGQKEKLKAVPNWQQRLREYVDQLLSDFSTKGSDG
ncbi:hypothetical protein WA1_09445 [Scytonema hofmannii PCC 7110]|jgi:hypothetical protein|uniref:Uncharacterized protein n=1 Tax=Scytonema hofmannii PCC 7110 TaxID=128403 RepID=A0A139WRA4_9CYAN|nr:hypothetical protein [Scytonema hofmannii]KYC34964.1 hypothetical protein WA1_09445 [Scytonema hofmannii PCC 7110]